jgi:hypothetical protein
MAGILTSYSGCVDLLILLGAFAKLREATVTSSCPPARMELLGSHLTDFHELSIFRKSTEKILLLLLLLLLLYYPQLPTTTTTTTTTTATAVELFICIDYKY